MRAKNCLICTNHSADLGEEASHLRSCRSDLFIKNKYLIGGAALNFTAPSTYARANLSPRPAKPANFLLELLGQFLNTLYARETTVATFLMNHPNAFTAGMLNQLHRRHIDSWDLIKRFSAAAAATNHTHLMKPSLDPIIDWFHLKPLYNPAASLPNRTGRATAFTNIANGMCWQTKNVFVGPSAGNVGAGLDQGVALDDQERRDLLTGTPWQGAGHVNSPMEGLVSANT